MFKKRKVEQHGDKSVYIENNLGIVNIYSDNQLPQILGTPPFRPEVFLGRNQELEDLQQHLFNDDHILLLVNGEGGIGKTTLAASYFYSSEELYTHRAWVFAEQSILDALLSLATSLKVDFPTQLTSEERLDVLLNQMRTLPQPCLLVIDNANHLTDLEKYYATLTTCPNFHVLLTTRISEFEEAKTYQINPLSLDAAISLFKKYYPKHKAKEDELLTSILEAIGRNTLVIELLAKNLHRWNRLRKNYSLHQLLKDLQLKGLLEIQSKTVSTTYKIQDHAYQKTTPEAIISAMYDLGELSESEQRLITIFAALPAENIPFNTLAELLPKTDDIEDTLLSLAQKGWLIFNEKEASFKTSPVIQEIARHKTDNIINSCGELIISLLEKINYELGTGNFVNASISDGVNYIYYSEFAFQVFQKAQMFCHPLGVMLNRIGNYYLAKGDLDNAMRYCKGYNELMNLIVNEYPNNSRFKNSLAVSFEKIGSVYSALGKLEDAIYNFKEYRRIALELCNQFGESGYSITLGWANQFIGNAYRDTSEFEKALQAYQEMHDIFAKLYETHKTNEQVRKGLAISYEKLGFIYLALGNYEDGILFLQQRKFLAEDLYNTNKENFSLKFGLTSAYEKLGAAYLALDELPDSQSNLENSYRLANEMLKEHPNIVKLQNTLGIICLHFGVLHKKKNDMSQAETFFQKAEMQFLELIEKAPKQLKFQELLHKTREELQNIR